MTAVDGEHVAARIEVLADTERPGGFLLLIDRIRQSYVDLEDPGYLDFEYMRWFAGAIDSLPAGPLTVTHIGGGAAAMPRWISASRPGSTHIVLEPDVELTELVRRRLPFSRDVRIRIRARPGRTGIAELRAASADLVILDAFDGGRVPADLTTAEFFAETARVLRPDGVFLANIGDGSALSYTRRVMAGVRDRVGPGMVISEKRVFGGARFGNVVLVGGPVDPVSIGRTLAAEVFPAQVRAGKSLLGWIGSAAPFTDADSSRSPVPPEASWRVN
ncbi:MAG: spermidine synthase [Jatrophihabitans sp.]